MTGEEIVEVVIGADGTVQIHVDGIAGTACIDETEDMVRLLGGQVESQELTGEAYVDAEREREQARRWH